MFKLGRVLAVVAALVIIFGFKIPGIFLALLVIGAVFYITRRNPHSPELEHLRRSIRLSADDIQNTIDAYESFCHSGDAEDIADRTLNRPALADKDCSDPTIQRFFFHVDSARRFLRRIDYRLHSRDTDQNHLENLLEATDRRATELNDSWLAARRAALKLGRKAN